MTNKMTSEYWELSEKQWQFALEYLIHFNQTHAAVAAGYSENGASVQGGRLLSNAKVAAALAFLIEERTKRTLIDADWLLERLAAEATADVSELYEQDGVSLKPVHHWPEVWRTGLVSGIKVEPKLQVEGVTLAVTDLKLSDRLKRLELIGKHIGVQAFSDKVDLSSKDGTMTPKNFNDFYDTIKTVT